MATVRPLHQRTADDQIVYLEQCGQYDVAAALKRFMNGSKVRQVLFHGTTHDFDAFEPEKYGCVYAFWGGGGVYLTSSPEDASWNYAGRGPDLEAKIDYRARQLLADWDEYGPPEEIKESYENVGVYERRVLAMNYAAKELEGASASVMPVFVRAENPVFLESNGGTIFRYQSYLHRQSRYQLEWINNRLLRVLRFLEGQLSDEARTALIKERRELEEKKKKYEALCLEYEREFWGGDGTRVLEAAIEVARDYNVDVDTVHVELKMVLEDEPTAFMVHKNLVKLFANALSPQGYYSVGEAEAEVWKRAGYDAIVAEACDVIGYMMGISPGVKHVFVFDPRRIKSAIGCLTYDMRSRSLTDADLRQEPIYRPIETVEMYMKNMCDNVVVSEFDTINRTSPAHAGLRR